MKNTIMQKILLIAFLGLFSQFSAAQDAATVAAAKQVADIVANLNHFPSDADKATLSEISGNSALPQRLRDMATAVSNIQHAATAEDKATMAEIQASDSAPDAAKALAGIIASINHVASPDAKAELAQLFP
ncbi:MAG: hypothetical protein DHS20C12_24550 [Pseudohongiella sp.]|nr:MAG: hypothetical protein DHS20C12_24550 [Pseudohongiella sp.]